MNKLKPCPFCEVDKASVLMRLSERPFGKSRYIDGVEHYTVVCRYGCYCQTNEFYTEEEAIKAWNTRSTK